MKSAFRQPLFFAILLVVCLAALTALATLSALTLAAQQDIPRMGWWTRLGEMILPAALLALVLVQLPAGLARRGGPLMLAAVALLACWGGRRLTDELSGQEGTPQQPVAPVVLVQDRFVPLGEPERYLFADQVGRAKATGVVVLDTSLDAVWHIRYLEEATIDAQENTIDDLPIGGEKVYGRMTTTGRALTTLQRDLALLIRDVEKARTDREELLLLLAPISTLAGLGFLVRRSRWPLIGAAVSLALSRAVLVVYRVAKDRLYAPVAELLAGWSHMFPALVLLSVGGLLILADVLTRGETIDA